MSDFTQQQTPNVRKQGINLMRVRQIHILEPYWNLVRNRQVVGRGVRTNSHHEQAPRSGKKEQFVYLPMTDEGGTIGTVIKSLTDIRQKAGAGAFIVYKREAESEAGPFGEWMAGQRGLKEILSHGAGWYIWAYSADSVSIATASLQEAEKAYVEKQSTYKRQAVKEKEKQKEQPQQQKAPTAVAFPPLGDNKTEVNAVTGAWAKGKPVEKVRTGTGGSAIAIDSSDDHPEDDEDSVFDDFPADDINDFPADDINDFPAEDDIYRDDCYEENDYEENDYDY